MKDFPGDHQYNKQDWLISHDQLQPVNSMNFLNPNNFQNQTPQRFPAIPTAPRVMNPLYGIPPNTWPQDQNHIVNLANNPVTNMQMQNFFPGIVYPQLFTNQRDGASTQQQIEYTNVYILKPQSGEVTIRDITFTDPLGSMQILARYDNEPIINSTGENREAALERVKKMVLNKYKESLKKYNTNNIFNLQSNPNPIQAPIATGINNFQYTDNTNNISDNYMQMMQGPMYPYFTGINQYTNNFVLPNQIFTQQQQTQQQQQQQFQQVVQQQQQQQQQQRQSVYLNQAKSRTARILRPQEPTISSMSGALDPSVRLPSPASENGNSNMNISNNNGSGKKKDNWVQCDYKNCRKWRRLPDFVDVSQLPSKWYCSMNKWDKNHNTCEAEEEEEDSEPKSASSSSSLLLLSSGQKRSRNYFNNNFYNNNNNNNNNNASRLQDLANESMKRSSNQVNTMIPSSLKINNNNTANERLLKPFEWIRCENPQCRKWRKLPPNISASDIPQPFYCVMNYWNFTLSSCDAPQEYNFEYDKSNYNIFGNVLNSLNKSNSTFSSSSQQQNQSDGSSVVSKEDEDLDLAIKRAKRNGFTVTKRGRVVKKNKYSDSFSDEDYGNDVVGSDLFIRSNHRDEGRQIRVIKYNSKKHEHLVEYEDGTQNYIHLSNYLVDRLSKND